MAQLIVRLLPTPEVRSSNPAIGKIYMLKRRMDHFEKQTKASQISRNLVCLKK